MTNGGNEVVEVDLDLLPKGRSHTPNGRVEILALVQIDRLDRAGALVQPVERPTPGGQTGFETIAEISQDRMRFQCFGNDLECRLPNGEVFGHELSGDAVL